MDEKEIIRENADSVELSKTSKGETSWKIKVYGDSKTLDGVKEIKRRLGELKAVATDASYMEK
jgi:hypothetical protein